LFDELQLYARNGADSTGSKSNQLKIQATSYFAENDKALTKLKQFEAVKCVFFRYNTSLPSCAPAGRLSSSAGSLL